MCKDPRKCPSSLSLKLKDEKTYTSVAFSIGPFFSKKKKKSIGPWKKENYEYLKEKTLFLRRRKYELYLCPASPRTPGLLILKFNN